MILAPSRTLRGDRYSNACLAQEEAHDYKGERLRKARTPRR